MNRLTQEQFNDRVQAVSRARRIFGELTEGNITRAFEAYQLILAEQEREIFITTAMSGNRPPSPFDKYDRPKCPDCGADMLFRILKENAEGYKVLLTCENPRCSTILYSENDIEWWEKELRRGPEQAEKGE